MCVLQNFLNLYAKSTELKMTEWKTVKREDKKGIICVSAFAASMFKGAKIASVWGIRVVGGCARGCRGGGRGREWW